MRQLARPSLIPVTAWLLSAGSGPETSPPGDARHGRIRVRGNYTTSSPSLAPVASRCPLPKTLVDLPGRCSNVLDQGGCLEPSWQNRYLTALGKTAARRCGSSWVSPIDAVVGVRSSVEGPRGPEVVGRLG